MKQFKNTFGVRSESGFLLEAFVKACKDIGWVYNNIGITKSNTVYFNNRKTDYWEAGTFWYCATCDNIYNLPEQWNEAIKAASETVEEKVLPKVGDWINCNKANSDSSWGIITRIGDEGLYDFSFFDFKDEKPNSWYFNEVVIMTPEERDAKITELCLSKGYKAGVKFKSPFSKVEFISSGNFQWNYVVDSIVNNQSGCIFDLDTKKWAEIIPDTVKILGYKAEIVRVNGEEKVKFGGQIFDKNELETIRTFLLRDEINPILTVRTSGKYKETEITSELIDELLKMFKD